MRKIFPIALMLLAACTGGQTPAGAPEKNKAPSSTASARPSPFFSPAEVTMFVGLDGEEGVLAVTCEDGSCRAVAPARPKRFLPGTETGLVSFTTGRPPSKARLEVRRYGRPSSGKPEQTVELTPKTLMATQISIPDGRYVVTLVGGWQGREARWVFGLDGPSGREGRKK